MRPIRSGSIAVVAALTGQRAATSELGAVGHGKSFLSPPSPPPPPRRRAVGRPSPHCAHPRGTAAQRQADRFPVGAARCRSATRGLTAASADAGPLLGRDRPVGDCGPVWPGARSWQGLFGDSESQTARMQLGESRGSHCVHVRSHRATAVT